MDRPRCSDGTSGQMDDKREDQTPPPPARVNGVGRQQH